jgi:hypothetical protein
MKGCAYYGVHIFVQMPFHSALTEWSQIMILHKIEPEICYCRAWKGMFFSHVDPLFSDNIKA